MVLGPLYPGRIPQTFGLEPNSLLNKHHKINFNDSSKRSLEKFAYLPPEIPCFMAPDPLAGC
jgi:hypothetical protein